VQLNIGDPVEGVEFYADLFGWDTGEEPMPGYHVFSKGEEHLGGITAFPEGCDHPSWIPFITVDDLDVILENVKGQGCRILQGPDALPDGRYFIFADPQGAPCGAAQYTVEPGDT
jgi:predicted enzyme related to lactoylglutathione lyase